MSKKATEFQKKEMSKLYRGKEIFKPMNAGWIDDHVGAVEVDSPGLSREADKIVGIDLRKITIGQLMCATLLGKICASDHAMNVKGHLILR